MQYQTTGTTIAIPKIVCKRTLNWLNGEKGNSMIARPVTVSYNSKPLVNPDKTERHSFGASILKDCFCMPPSIGKNAIFINTFLSSYSVSGLMFARYPVRMLGESEV
jgi:hypothetical protein